MSEDETLAGRLRLKLCRLAQALQVTRNDRVACTEEGQP